ncbi:MAG TPA: hypothetical protein VJI15_00750 [Candidatus Nanoarchaeia archaeon]|nr:hypothetical protein [Candidatus Nanoarchaeia archaeon]
MNNDRKENYFFHRITTKQALVEGAPYHEVERAWGASAILDSNTRIHHIIDEPSVQVHSHRTEEYVLVSGSMVVYRGTYYPNDPEKTIANLHAVVMQPGDKVVIPMGMVHAPVNISLEGGSTFIEISHGFYDEEDIKRIYDKKGRDASLKEKWAALRYPSGLSVRELIPLVRFRLEDKGRVVNNGRNWLYYEKDGAKFVTKPWGNATFNGIESVGEVWLNYRFGEEVGAEEKPYVFKKLYVKKGTKMSFQHHEKKREINFLVKGRVEAWYENAYGEIEKKVVEEGGLWEIIPPKRHRTIALEDSIIIECSTPEVDDVVRHEDDASRGDGRIEKEHSLPHEHKP